MKIWENHGLALQAEKWGKNSSFSLFCTNPNYYQQLSTFPNNLEQGITLAEANKFFLPFNAVMHLLHESSFLDDLKQLLPNHADILDYYFLHDLQKTLNIIISAPLENAHAHGNNFDPQKMTSLTIEFEENNDSLTLIVTVTDEGEGFEWKHAKEAHNNSKQSYHAHENNPNPHYKKNFAHAQGTALYALFDLCNSVEFNEKGNEIVLRKELIMPKL